MSLPHAKAVVTYESLGELSRGAAKRIASLSARSIAERGVFRVALAGGETPRGCYRQLRSLPVDWEHVHIYFGDERCLPRGDARRNDTMAAEELIDHVPVLDCNVHPISAEHGAQIAAAEYEAVLALAQPLDLVLLGLGEDGHTASLFPGNPATIRENAVVPVFYAPKPPPERVSLGMHTLNAAREKMFLVAGRGKRDALSQIAQGADLPAAQVIGAEWHIARAALPRGFLQTS